MTLQKLAQQVLSQLHTQTRDNGQQFVSLKDTHEEWMQDVCREAHGDMLPDDQRYEMIQEALQALVDAEDQDEAVDQLEADIYTSDLLGWVSSSLSRAEYVNEAVRNTLGDASQFDMISALQLGQIEEKREVCILLVQALENKMDEIETEVEA